MESDKILRDLIVDAVAMEEAYGPTEKIEIERQYLELVWERMVTLVHEEAEQLAEEARAGNVSALEYLLDLASATCRPLQELCLNNPELVQPIAEKCPAWPVFTNNTTLVRDATTRLLDSIHVAAKATTPLDVQKFFDRTTPAREILGTLVLLIDSIRDRLKAMRTLAADARSMSEQQLDFVCQSSGFPRPDAPQNVLDAHVKKLVFDPQTYARLQVVLELEDPFAQPGTLELLIKGCAAIPPLTRADEAITAWMKIIRDFITAAHAGHPEKSQKLRVLGQSREGKSATAPRGSDTAEANIRDGIFLSLRQTLRNMAAE